jgi:hypothetical protein
MPKQPDLIQFLGPWIHRLVEILASDLERRLAPYMNGEKRPVTNGAAKAPYKLDMRCRWPRCHNTSRGPRNRYMCDEHKSKPLGEIRKAVAEYRQHKHASEIASRVRASRAA